MSDALAGAGWLITASGMTVHLIGVFLDAWPSDYTVTWAIPLVGCALMAIAVAVE